MIKKILFLFFLSILMFPVDGNTKHFKTTDKIVYGGDYDHAPFEFLDSHGKPAGFHIDLMIAIGEVMDFEVEFELAPWIQIRREIEMGGKIDVSDMFHAPFREKIVDFTVAHTSVYHEIIARKTGAYQNVTIEDLRGQKVIVEASSYLQNYIELKDFGIKLILVETESAALRLLASGRHDYAIVSQHLGHEYINTHKEANLIPAGDPVFLRELALVVPQGRHDLLEKLDKGVETLKESGKYSEIYVKWFGTPHDIHNGGMAFQEVMYYIGITVGPIALIAFVIALWSYSLKKQVDKKTHQLKDELQARYRVQNLLEENNKELTKTNEELDQFVYVTSHDIRAPLTSILGLINLIMVEPDSLNKYLKLIEQSINKLDRFTSDILDYAKNSRMGIKQDPINFKELLEDSYSNLKYLNKDEKVLFEHHIEDKDVFYSDQLRLKIIFNNLLSNAFKYHKENRDNPFVRVDIRTSPEKCDILIIDNGQGIENDRKDKIFEMFYKGNLNSTGAGIGLYIVKESVKKLNGEVDLVKTSREGSVFSVSIPNHQSN